MEREIRNVAVIDIGKTNAKLVLHDLETADDLAVLTTPNIVLNDGPYPHYDIDHLWRFILEGLVEISHALTVDAISLTTHGASIALLGPDDLALPVLDYEYQLDAEFLAAYRDERPDFSETQSPALPGGLNVGAQLAWLEARFRERFASAETILTYPQYWAYRLTGVKALEVTQLGCHTDLWRPVTRDFSSLVDRRGWRGKFAPLRSAFDELGPLRPAIREPMAGDWDIPVFCGIHDSNASLLPHLMTRQAPFTVVSTGTWAVLFAVGAEPTALDKDRDTLANVDAFGRPVPSARFMAGREFTEMAGAEPGEASREAAERVIARQAMALPSFAKGTGPFPTRTGDWTLDPATLDQGERTAAASLSAALTTETCLSLIGACGPIIVEGPFAKNTVYCDALEALTGQPVEAKPGLTGTAAGAALLARGKAGGPWTTLTETKEPQRRAPWPGLQAYAETWRRRVTVERAAEAGVMAGGERS